MTSEEAKALPHWRRNLLILWIADFIAAGGMSMVIPFLPLYIQDLGVKAASANERWSGFVFAANFLTAALVSPWWGSIADRYGRKLMLIRSGVGMAVVVALMGAVPNVWSLLGLRLIQGAVAGFIPASIALMAANTPSHEVGYALGILQTGQVTGNIVGPLLGGLMAEVLTYRHVFWLTSIFLLGATVLSWYGIQERFSPAPRGVRQGLLAELRLVTANPTLRALFTVLFLTQLAVMSIEPIITLFMQQLAPEGSHIKFWAGLIFAVTGIANVIAAPFWGRRGDRRGYKSTLLWAMGGAFLFYIPQAFVQAPWQLLVFRFGLGLFIGGMIPTANALINSVTADHEKGRAYGLTTSALFLGNLAGPILGGQVAGLLNIRAVFAVTAALLLLDLLWVRRTVKEAQVR